MQPYNIFYANAVTWLSAEISNMLLILFLNFDFLLFFVSYSAKLFMRQDINYPQVFCGVTLQCNAVGRTVSYFETL